jgi:hypothetical protein
MISNVIIGTNPFEEIAIAFFLLPVFVAPEKLVQLREKLGYRDRGRTR